MDFFNYAGIHRPVKLYTVPANIYVEDVSVSTSYHEDLNFAGVLYQVFVSHFSLFKFGCTKMVQREVRV